MSILSPTTFGPVQSLDELNGIVLELSAKYPDRLILFRGQRQLHESIRSGRARPDIKIHKDVEAGWRSLSMRMLELELSSERNSYGYARAILQHYGMATHFVDLTSDVEVAAWFATRKYGSRMMLYAGSSMRQYEHVIYEQSNEEYGYVLVLAIEGAQNLRESGRLFDLATLPDGCARPHRQKGWLMLDRPPTQPTPNSFWAATIKIDTKVLKTKFRTMELFPGPKEDAAFEMLLSLPFVQVPSAYFNPNDDPKKPKLSEELEHEMETFCLAQRALSIPEYGNDIKDECIDHKWGDFTIYEPHHMRMWKWWRFDLASVHPGTIGDIKDTVKITLSPEATQILFSVQDRRCSWPSLGTDGLFFTFAALDHDKVIDHAPPYYGVWLQRDDELIVETPMEADTDALNVMAGHSYFLRDGVVERQVMESACKCGKPETHDERVRSVLQLSSLLQDGTLILLPHPSMSQLGWHVVITGAEGREMIPRVTSFQKVVKALNKHGPQPRSADIDMKKE